MKNVTQKLGSIAILFAVFTLMSCDEVEELTQFDFETEFTEEFTVNLSDEGTSLSESITINLSDNEDVAPYIGNIEEIEITEASYVIKNYVGMEEATGSISATAASQNFGPYEHTFYTDAQSATSFEFNDVDKLNTVADSLLSNNEVEVQFSGTQNPAQNGSFVIEVTFKLNVTAQVL